MRYYKFPKWLKPLYPGAIWDFSFKNQSAEQKIIYLTFDDGPNPESTAWILKLLEKYEAQATFFCLGKNVERYPALYQKILDGEHKVGNHTQNHLNGFYTKTKVYVKDLMEARQFIDSNLFRPPYGKMSPKQFKAIKNLGFKTVFWTHITYDFDSELKASKRKAKTLKRVKNGSIVVFHDSDKAFVHLKNELPELLAKWKKEGYIFEKINEVKFN